MARINTFKLRKSFTVNSIPNKNDLEYGELTINVVDGNLYSKQAILSGVDIVDNKVVSFLGTDNIPFTLNKALSSINYNYGQNKNTGIHSNILGGIDNDNSAFGSTII